MAAFLPQAAAAALPFILSYFQGQRTPQMQQIPTTSQAQQDLLDEIIRGVMGGGGQFGLGGDIFQQGFAEPLLETFERRTIPAMQSGFSSRGLSGGKLQADATARAAENVQRQIAQEGARYQAGLTQQALGQRQFQPMFVREAPGFAETALQPLAQFGEQQAGNILNEILKAATGGSGVTAGAPALGSAPAPQAMPARSGFRG